MLKSDMFGKELLFIIESTKKTIFFILKILIENGECLGKNTYISKKVKQTIFYILKILIKIGNVWERIFIYHKKYKKKQY
jgi:hypothetical protein